MTRVTMVALRNSVFGIVFGIVYRLLMKLKRNVSVFNSCFGCSSTECTPVC
uniref:Uncharacterized protein n=1 Tax=Anguilla anguilla TaxID=7936 RepID=A0A0E9VSB0_ANGAN